MRHAQMLFIVACSILVLSPFTANALTFTLSDDAIMALDFDYYDCDDSSAIIKKVTNVAGPGVRFDILFSDPLAKEKAPYIQRISGKIGGKGLLTGVNIGRYDTFALKFTLLSARGVSTPDAIDSIIVGAMVTQPDSEYAFYPEVIALNDIDNPPNAVSATITDGADVTDLVGFTCYIPYWWFDDSTPSPWDPTGAKISLLVEPADNALALISRPIEKCTVIAGKTKEHSSISISGKILNIADDLSAVSNVAVYITSPDMGGDVVVDFPVINNSYSNTGKFTYSGTDSDGVKKSLKLNLKTRKFSFRAQNIDLSGLSCPFDIRLDTGNDTELRLDENIVNGPHKPIPINFLMDLSNAIRVDAFKVKYGYKKNSSSLVVKGGFSVDSAQNARANMIGSDFVINLAGQPFTIPAQSFKPNKTNTRFTCSNVKLDGVEGVAAATFDFNKCTFAVTIKKTDINATPGDAQDLTINLAGFVANTEVDIR